MEEPAGETPVGEKGEKMLEEPPEVTDEPVEESAPVADEATGPSPELTVKQIWDAPKTQLRAWCQQLGLDDTGPIMNLRLRLQSRLE
jgi:hypothetical protein